MSDRPTDSELADAVRQFRDDIQDMVPEQDHMAKAVHAHDLAEDLDTILEENDAQAPRMELVVEFTQRFTVRPPEDLTDPVHAKDWFWNIYPELGYDVVDTRNQDHYEILAARPVDFDD